MAKRVVDGNDVELWCLGPLVIRLPVKATIKNSRLPDSGT
jgi:hypothetical protein